MSEIDWDDDSLANVNEYIAFTTIHPWWAKDGIRLSLGGYHLLKHLKFKSYKLRYEDTLLTPTILLGLARVIPNPYYIEQTRLGSVNGLVIHFFGAKEAAFAILNKDLDTFLKNYA